MNQIISKSQAEVLQQHASKQMAVGFYLHATDDDTNVSPQKNVGVIVPKLLEMRVI